MADLLDLLFDVLLGGTLLAVAFYVAVRLRARRFQRMRRLAGQLGCATPICISAPQQAARARAA